MAIRTTVVGSYPKPPAEGETFVVRKTLHAIERGEATADDLQAAQADLVRAVIREQEAAGLDVITDGLVRWDDIVTPFARNLGGFEIGGLLRWFDNNVYYRRPVCTGPIEWQGPTSTEGFGFAQGVAERPVKAILPGPITFARLSVDEHYADHGAFVEALTPVLAREARALESAGATTIQIDEPALLGAPEDLALARMALAAITSELSSASLILATYFGDAKRLGTELFELPVDGFGFDLVSGPESIELIRDLPSDKWVQAGIVDARNTMLEDASDVAAVIHSLLDAVGPDRLWLSPSAGLEFLPREKARAKLERLVQIAKEVGA